MDAAVSAQSSASERERNGWCRGSEHTSHIAFSLCELYTAQRLRQSESAVGVNELTEVCWSTCVHGHQQPHEVEAGRSCRLVKEL